MNLLLLFLTYYYYNLLIIECKSNVCKTFLGYYIKPISKQCWYNPDFDQDFPLLVEQHNYTLETYNVTTDDGYILKVFRLPRTDNRRGVVFLQHPVTSTASIWVDKGNRSLGYILYREGYDVWMGNFRGNYYSRQHITLDPRTNEFWNFSFHEHGISDIPAQVEFIIRETRVDKIAFVGHSMGSQAAVIYASLLPEHASKYINIFILHSPPISFNHATSPLLKLAAFGKSAYKAALKSHEMEVLPRNAVMKHLTKYCNMNPIGIQICAQSLNNMYGNDWDNVDPELIPIAFSQQPAGLSMKTLYHYGQMVTSKRFAYFDHGKKLNKRYYRSPTPPDYPLDKINARMVVLAGTVDTVVNIEDIRHFVDQVKQNPNATIELIEIPNANHIDFAYSKNIASMIFQPTLKRINKVFG